jgi:hypothetical protein
MLDGDGRVVVMKKNARISAEYSSKELYHDDGWGVCCHHFGSPATAQQ